MHSSDAGEQVQCHEFCCWCASESFHGPSFVGSIFWTKPSCQELLKFVRFGAVTVEMQLSELQIDLQSVITKCAHWIPCMKKRNMLGTSVNASCKCTVLQYTYDPDTLPSSALVYPWKIEPDIQSMKKIHSAAQQQATAFTGGFNAIPVRECLHMHHHTHAQSSMSCQLACCSIYKSTQCACCYTAN